MITTCSVCGEKFSACVRCIGNIVLYPKPKCRKCEPSESYMPCRTPNLSSKKSDVFHPEVEKKARAFKKRVLDDSMERKINMAIKEGETEFSYGGSIDQLCQEMKDAREGVYIAYDEDLFEALNILGDRLKTEPALVLLKALRIGLLQLVDEIE